MFWNILFICLFNIFSTHQIRTILSWLFHNMQIQYIWQHLTQTHYFTFFTKTKSFLLLHSPNSEQGNGSIYFIYKYNIYTRLWQRLPLAFGHFDLACTNTCNSAHPNDIASNLDMHWLKGVRGGGGTSKGVRGGGGYLKRVRGGGYLKRVRAGGGGVGASKGYGGGGASKGYGRGGGGLVPQKGTSYQTSLGKENCFLSII